MGVTGVEGCLHSVIIVQGHVGLRGITGRDYSSDWLSDESLIFVEAISRPMEKPIPSTMEKPTITGAAIAQKRQGSPAASPQTNRPKRTTQMKLIILPPIRNVFIACLYLLQVVQGRERVDSFY